MGILDTPAASRKQMRVDTNQIVPIQFNYAGGTSGAGFIDTVTSVGVRTPIRVAAKTKRGRYVLRNYNDRASLAYTGALSYVGVSIGVAEIDSNGNMTGNTVGTPQPWLGPFTTPANGDEYASAVTDYPFELQPYTDYILISGYTCAAQTNFSGPGGGWRSTVPTDYLTAAPGNLTQVKYLPILAWIESEFAGDVPVLIGYGDSTMGGSESSLPVRDSYLNKHCLANGILPWFYAHHGSLLTSWADPTAYKYTKFSRITAKADGVIMALGQNDISNNNLFSSMQANFLALVAIMRAMSTNITLLSIKGNNTGDTSPQQMTRDQYNDWLRALRAGATNFVDIWGAIADPVIGTGTYSAITSVVTATVIPVAKAVLFRVGDTVDIATTTTTPVAGRTITAVDPVGNTVTISGAAVTTTTSQFVVRQGRIDPRWVSGDNVHLASAGNARIASVLPGNLAARRSYPL